MKFSIQIAPKSRITEAEATVVQLVHIAVRQERPVFVPALTFLLLFASRQKVNNNNIHQLK
jgi:hypothetical protein